MTDWRSSRDPDGHYCGQDAITGEAAPTPEGLVGYCGPRCGHCIMPPRVYVVQDGVYVCAADYEYGRHGR